MIKVISLAERDGLYIRRRIMKKTTRRGRPTQNHRGRNSSWTWMLKGSLQCSHLLQQMYTNLQQKRELWVLLSIINKLWFPLTKQAWWKWCWRHARTWEFRHALRLLHFPVRILYIRINNIAISSISKNNDYQSVVEWKQLINTFTWLVCLTPDNGCSVQ